MTQSVCPALRFLTFETAASGVIARNEAIQQADNKQITKHDIGIMSGDACLYSCAQTHVVGGMDWQFRAGFYGLFLDNP
ncbi:MAG: hypothetical protein LBF85_07265 [Tannerella sp.]|jgi:hypothetical protein|nr:hypothetical protein [Tannerella sp.]